MIKEIYRLRMVIWLALIVVGLSILKIKYGWKEENTTVQPTITQPTITKEPTKIVSSPAILKVDEEKYPLWDQLPYPGDGFVVKRYASPKVLLVELEKATTESATRAIKVWLEGFGDAGKGHKIQFEN